MLLRSDRFRENLAGDRVVASGTRFEESNLFLDLGVSQYFSEAAFDQSLRFVLSTPAQSERFKFAFAKLPVSMRV
jgi:O-methyltransferase involved in polyketide biosynthesis